MNNFKPILAKSFNAEKHNCKKFLMSEKLDGIRSIWNGKELFTRNGKKLNPTDDFINKLPKNVWLDGELISPNGFQKTCSIVKTLKFQNPSWSEIKFYIFDVPKLNEPFEKRIEFYNQFKNDIIIPVLQIPCDNIKHLNSFLEKITNKGGEGVMLRLQNSFYENKRSSTLLKVKKFFDREAIVLSYIDGKGKHKGKMGAIKVKCLTTNTEFKVGSGFKDRERENPPKIGSIITYKYQELTKGGKPRFPVFLRCRNDL